MYRSDNDTYIHRLLKAHKARVSKKARKNIVNNEVILFILLMGVIIDSC